MSDAPQLTLDIGAPSLFPTSNRTAPPPKTELPSADEIFPMPLATDVFPDPKPFINKLPLVDHFIRGFDLGYGEDFLKKPLNSKDPQSKTLGDWFRQVGILGPADAAKRTIVQQFNESLLYSVAVPLQSIAGTIYGASEVLHSGLGVPKDLTPAAWLEAFPVGRPTGLPGRIPLGPSPLARPGALPYAVDWNAAAELGVLGERTAQNVAREKLAPGSTPTEFPLRGAPPESAVPEASPLSETAANAASADPIHAIARQIDPDVIQQMDDLRAQKRTLTDYIDEAAANNPTVKRIEEEIATILGKVNNVESRLTNRAAARLETLRDGLDEARLHGSAEAEWARDFRVKVDEQMRDLAPRYTEVYEEARRQAPIEPELAVEPTAQAPLESVPTRDPRITEIEARLRSGQPLTEEQIRNITGVTADEATAVKAELAEAKDTVTRQNAILSLSQRLPSIATDTARRLERAGLSPEVASASGRLVQAYYETRAARFRGALGTAQELYGREAPLVSRGESAGRGRTIIGRLRNTIQLMERADASTFMHESAHNWMLDLEKDAQHSAAPPELRADLATVRDWLGAEGDAPLTRAQHEKFARGFERYLMEGQAPSSKLASVFEKFKQWLTDIYQTVARLRAPITDDIRAVYDRLLSSPSREPIIASEREGARTFAEDARAAVDETPAADAAARADREASIRERVVEQLKDEIRDRRREARRGPARVGVVEERGGEPGAEPVRTVVAETDASVDAGRDPTAPESQTPPSGTEQFDRTTRLVDKAGNIRIENLVVPDDVAEAIRESAGRNNNYLEARRAVLSDPEVLKLAEDLGVDPNKIDRWATAEAWTAEQIVFARKLLRDSATKVLDAAKRLEATADGTLEGEKALAEYVQAVNKHDMIQQRVSAVTAESGRAFRAGFRALTEEDKAVKEIGSLLQQTIGTSPAAIRRQARLMSSAGTTSQVSNMVQSIRASPSRMFVEGYVNSLVSGPWTHVVNMTSNLGVSAGIIAETAAAAGVGRIFRALGKEQGVTFREAIDRAHGLAEGSLDGLKAFGAVIMDENAIPRTHTEVGIRHAIPSTITIAGVKIPAGTAVRFPGRLLTAMDELFKAIAWQQEINVLARRAALQEGLQGDALKARMNWHKANPTDSMRAAAEQFGEYQTFQTQLGSAGKSMVGFAEAHPLMRLIFPFIRTPINLFKYSIERTPLGLASAEVRARLMSDNPAVRDMQIGRMALGSLVGVGTGFLAFQGLVSGGGPVDADERQALIRTGWQPYSVNIGGLWISYQRFDPFSTIMGLSADAAMIAKYGFTGKDELGHDLEANRFRDRIVISLWKNIIDKMALRGATSLVQAATDPARFGDQYIQNLAGTLVVPPLLSQIARMEDPFDRETKSIRDSVMSRVPWAREDLFPKRDIWGEPISATDYGPTQIRKFNADPVNRIMLDLGIAKAKPDRNIGGVELTEAQYDEYARVSGQQAKQILNTLMLQPGFTEMPKGAQVMAINNVIDGARAMGRAHIMQQSIGTADDLIKKGLDVRTMFLETGHRR